MPGRQLDDECSGEWITEEDRIGISYAMGEALAGLQNLKNPFCGEYDAFRDDFKPFGKSHYEYISERLCGDIERTGGTISSEDKGWVGGLLQRAKDSLDDGFTPTFVMQDYKAGNSVVQCTDGHWTDRGVFDFMEPFFADGEMDLCRHMCCCMDAGHADSVISFVAGYVSKGALRPGAELRFSVYLLLDRLIIWNFGWRHGIWWDKELSFRSLINLDPLLEAFQQGATGVWPDDHHFA